MIAFLDPLPIGTAVRVLLAPPSGAVNWRVLRKPTDNIADQNDAEAARVYEGNEKSFVDIASLTNGATYYYKPFYQDAAGAWTTSASMPGEPQATANLSGPDPLSIVKQRMEAGLKVEVSANRLPHELGYIPCFSAPPVLENIKFPIVTVHLRNQQPAHRGLGELVASEVFDELADDWIDGEGVINRYQLDVIGWVTGNADVRIALRKAMTKVLIGNLGVFADAGLSEVEFSAADVEDFESYNTQMYQTIFTFTCLASAVVDDRELAIDDVTVMATA